MFRNVKRTAPTLDEVTSARVLAEKQFDQLHALEHTYQLLPLAQRLHAQSKRFANQGLFLAFHADSKYPAIYIVKQDHSRWCRIWRCGSDGGFRLDADDCYWSTDYFRYEVMKRDLSANVQLAERCIMGMLDRDELKFGNSYLPGDLRPINEIVLPALLPAHSDPAAALPPPTIDATAVEVRATTPRALPAPTAATPIATRPAAPAGLRAVPLATPAKPPRKGWFG